MFVEYHLTIEKKEFERRDYGLDPFLAVEEINTDFNTFMSLFKRVGSPWGWDRRPKYCDNREGLEERVAAGRIHLLKKFNEVVGYCFSVEKGNMTSEFNRGSMVEIENFGLFPEQNGKSYGKTYLPKIFNELFKGNDIVYLSSRSTNHVKVIPFYQSLGMKVIESIKMEDDLYDRPAEWMHMYT